MRSLLKNKDVRIKILENFNILNNDKSEIGANDWFFNESYDVAKVRNSLLELVEIDFIRFANMTKEESIKFLQEKLYTEPSTNVITPTEDDLNRRSYKRFIQQVGNHKEITEFRIHTTIKGINYLKEQCRFKYENLTRFGFLVLGILLTLISTIGSAYVIEKYISPKTSCETKSNTIR